MEDGVAVNVNNKYNGMPLYEAARNEHLTIVQVLLKMDADVNVRYSDNQCHCIERQNIDIYALSKNCLSVE
jgi:ankyrin repeat protein